MKATDSIPTNLSKSEKPVNTKFVLKPVTPQKIKEATAIINDAFVDANPVWVKLKVNREEGLKVMTARVEKCQNSGLSLMMVVPETDQIAMVAMCIDLVDYLGGPKGKLLYEWQGAIAEAAKEMELDYFLSLQPKRGEYIYVDSTTVNPKFMNQNLNYLFWSKGFKYVHDLGYKTVFARAANPKSSISLVKFGGRVVSEKTLKFKDAEDETMHLIQIDLDSLKNYRAKL